MTGKDIIMAKPEDLKRLHIIRKAMEKEVTQIGAGEILRLSDRQVRRIIKNVKYEGDAGIIHKSRGKPSNRTISKKIKEKALKHFRNKYHDFGPTLASEKLLEIDGIKVNDETLRLWLIKDKISYSKRKKRPHREWRERKQYFGEMIQADGSHHDWFELGGNKCVLMGYIDDATGTVFARFYTYEGTFPFMDSFRYYIKKYGLPLSVYVDKHSTYKSTKKASIEDELKNRRPLSEVERVLKELGVNVIHANSPQAKGRIERLFNTFQDRVVKEMRLKKVKTIEQANKFLVEYLPKYNARFTKEPVQNTDLHRPIPKGINLGKVFRIKTERVLRNDFTVIHENRIYQIKDNLRANKVIVEEKIDGSMEITYKNSPLKFKEIIIRPKKEIKKELKLTSVKINIPGPDHSWRKFRINSQTNNYSQNKKESILTTT